MQPHRGIVRTYRHSNGIFMRPDDLENLTCQSAGTPPPPPETRSTNPLHGILSNMDRSTSKSMVKSVVPRGITIIAKSEHSSATSRARPLPRLIGHYEPCHRHWHFCTVQRFRLSLNQVFQWDSTKIFLNLFDSTSVGNLESNRFRKILVESH